MLSKAFYLLLVSMLLYFWLWMCKGGLALRQMVSEREFLSVWIDHRMWGSLHQDLRLGEVCQEVLDCVDRSPTMRQFARGACVAWYFSFEEMIMEKGKKKMNFLIGWILRIPRLKKNRARNQEVLRVAFFDLQKQVNELEVELWKRRVCH